MRIRWMNSGYKPEFYDAELDAESQEYIKKIIGKLGGWPKISEFGKNVPEALWVLVQHVPDLEIIKEMLAAMQRLPKVEVNQKNVARTIDRILTREDQPQLYGTSWKIEHKTQTLSYYPVDDEEHVDERRASMGLDTFTEQKDRAYKSYQEHLDKKTELDRQ